jgi:hypothetical protein
MSKKDDILKALQRGEKLTPLGALKRFGCMTLSQRVSEWRRAGMPIRDKFVEGENYKVYWWDPQEPLLG